MLNSQHEEESPATYHGSDSVGAVAPDTSTELIEDYLDRVCAPLIDARSWSRRQEIRDRVRERILQFARAHEELGSSAEDAVSAALSQCGEPEVLAERWLSGSTARAKHVTGTATTQQLTLRQRLFGGAYVSTAVAAVLFGTPYVLDVTQASSKLWGDASNHFINYYRVWLFLVPLIAGMLTGALCKKKPVRGVFNALAALCVPAILFPGMLFGLSYANVLLSDSAHLDWVPNLLPAVCGIVPWFALGCLGATVGARFRNQITISRSRKQRKNIVSRYAMPLRNSEPGSSQKTNSHGGGTGAADGINAVDQLRAGALEASR